MVLEILMDLMLMVVGALNKRFWFLTCLTFIICFLSNTCVAVEQTCEHGDLVSPEISLVRMKRDRIENLVKELHKQIVRAQRLQKTLYFGAGAVTMLIGIWLYYEICKWVQSDQEKKVRVGIVPPNIYAIGGSQALTPEQERASTMRYNDSCIRYYDAYTRSCALEDEEHSIIGVIKKGALLAVCGVVVSEVSSIISRAKDKAVEKYKRVTDYDSDGSLAFTQDKIKDHIKLLNDAINDLKEERTADGMKYGCAYCAIHYTSLLESCEDLAASFVELVRQRYDDNPVVSLLFEKKVALFIEQFNGLVNRLEVFLNNKNVDMQKQVQEINNTCKQLSAKVVKFMHEGAILFYEKRERARAPVRLGT